MLYMYLKKISLKQPNTFISSWVNDIYLLRRTGIVGSRVVSFLQKGQSILFDLFYIADISEEYIVL